ncbi:3839_t:CDS:2 [Ambispora gerdemannii]|uniref:3839_t:CDS:1 n=1 Tax=Ambispora gerdemannii TaxID=144530 RepID=A0A9N8ZDB4_9GLOM|nr:3839_t:CDS:2 [Ambispora gerdemannii]
MLNSVVSANYNYLDYDELLILSECPYKLTLSIEELTKSAVKKRGNSEKPPRPQNSWIIFRRDYEAQLRLFNQHTKQKVKETAKKCSLKWQELSNEVKHFFKILEKIACENHKNLYPNYKYKPRNAKDSNIKKWVFREQKKYAFVSLPISSSMSENSPPQKIVRSPSLNDTILTIGYKHPVIVSTSIDDTHSSAINTNNDNGIISLDQFPFLSGNVDINVNNKEVFFDESFIVSNHDNASINNSSPSNQLITNNPIIPLTSSPPLESQSFSRLFIPGDRQMYALTVIVIIITINLSFAKTKERVSDPNTKRRTENSSKSLSSEVLSSISEEQLSESLDSSCEEYKYRGYLKRFDSKIVTTC